MVHEGINAERLSLVPYRGFEILYGPQVKWIIGLLRIFRPVINICPEEFYWTSIRASCIHARTKWPIWDGLICPAASFRPPFKQPSGVLSLFSEIFSYLHITKLQPAMLISGSQAKMNGVIKPNRLQQR